MYTFYIKTYGCQMNERDSESLSALLQAEGHQEVALEEAAQVLIFNTCSVREQAERKVIGKVGILKRLKARKPAVKLGIIGCMGQRLGEKLFEILPHLDFVVGTDQLAKVPKIFDELEQGKTHLTALSTGGEIVQELDKHLGKNMLAYISVMRGCDQFCTYCIVPHTRGREKSRTIEAITAEVREQVERGSKEILLLGQNITAYGVAEARKAGQYSPEFSAFADLLQALHEIPGLLRIRFTSPHVRYMNQKFIETVCKLPKVCKAFHIPLQSGCNRILAAMNRGYTVEEYLACIENIRNLAPQANFSTDIIVGFPGETRAEFEQTRHVMQQVQYDMAYIFRYSEREGTRAAQTLLDEIPEEEKMVRNQVLLNDLTVSVEQRNKAYLGRSVEVLVEGKSKRNTERWTGRSDLNKVCIFPPLEKIVPGQLCLIQISRTTTNSLFGKIIEISQPQNCSDCSLGEK
ncbi:MAG: tRNA (N6-isopentenyl adenosine(37)-C2)-methylthiotransferase MiaB [Lentisphaeria bacterium]